MILVWIIVFCLSHPHCGCTCFVLWPIPCIGAVWALMTRFATRITGWGDLLVTSARHWLRANQFRSVRFWPVSSCPWCGRSSWNCCGLTTAVQLPRSIPLREWWSRWVIGPYPLGYGPTGCSVTASVHLDQLCAHVVMHGVLDLLRSQD